MTGDVTTENDSIEDARPETEDSDDEALSEVTSLESPLLSKGFALFERGDYKQAKQVLGSIPDSEDPAVLAKRDELLARIKPDRVAIIVSAVCLVIVMVVFFFATHRG